MSTAARRWSKSIDAVKRFTRSLTGSEKRPDHPPLLFSGADAGGLEMDMAIAGILRA